LRDQLLHRRRPGLEADLHLAGHGDVRQTWNRYGHLLPGGEEEAASRLDVFLQVPKPTVAHPLGNAETPVNTGVSEYRYRDSNPGFRRERAAS
jgi:hypothetical protein